MDLKESQESLEGGKQRGDMIELHNLKIKLIKNSNVKK